MSFKEMKAALLNWIEEMDESDDLIRTIFLFVQMLAGK